MEQFDTECALKQILAITERLNHFKDLDSVLDHILYGARQFTKADAGSIFLLEQGKLKFSYVQNDTLFKKGANNKYHYSQKVLDLNHQSIAGHVALSGEALRLRNVHRLPEAVPYRFNSEFDHNAHYRTRSMLAVPLVSGPERVVGVMALINALDAQAQVTQFTSNDEMFACALAHNAAAAIERAILNREMILRMLATSAMRDPHETGAHVNRVGAYSAELYQRWALNSGVPYDEMRRQRDVLRLAAMLHDIGKVAISDLILKKPARLSSSEFEVMKGHTVYGARLFHDGSSDLDCMSSEIALNHHERWDGQGYPGKVEDLFREPIRMARGKKNAENSVFGSIVAIADVYDALSSPRVYKEAWPQERVMEEISRSAGSHFNPQMVSAFVAIYEVIDAIRAKYAEAILN